MTATAAAQWRAEHIDRLVAAAPPLGPAQRDRLAVLLRPAASQGAAAR